MSDDILDLIDGAVADWETGKDAVRYNGPEPAEDEGAVVGVGALFHVAAEFELQMLAFQYGVITLTETIDAAALEQHAQRLRELHRQRTCFFCGTSWFGAGDHECNPRPYDAWAEHQMRVQLLKAYRVRPHEIGIGNMGCACHPAPFPVARDYRRRTKHRNRRR